MFKLQIINTNLSEKPFRFDENINNPDWITIYESYSHFGILDFVLNKLNDQEFTIEGLKFRIINPQGKILNF